MKSLVTMLLLLAPLPPVRAALVFDSETCCASNVRPDDVENLNDQGSRFYSAGDYSSAGRSFTEALRLEQQSDPPDQGSLANTLFNLGAVARMQSRLSDAEALYKQSIALREAVSGPDSPQLAHALSGLALVYRTGGRLAEARQFAERAVRVSSDPREVAVAQNTLATILMEQGESAQAEALEQHVIDELRRASATATQDYLNALTNLGTSRLRQAKYGQAELDLREAERTALLVAGPAHPLTATVWNNLAKVRAARGDWRQAEALFQKAIDCWRRGLGPAHPDVAYGLSNLASLYRDRKRYSDAERLYRQALEIDQAALGPNCLKVANDWNNLGALSALMHHAPQAESSLSKALAIARTTAGPDHPDTAAIAVNLAMLYLSRSRYTEACALFAKALPVEERVLGKDSPDLALLLRLYASSLKADRNYADAERAELQATRITTHAAL